jgi:hypothetical protein
VVQNPYHYICIKNVSYGYSFAMKWSKSCPNEIKYVLSKKSALYHEKKIVPLYNTEAILVSYYLIEPGASFICSIIHGFTLTHCSKFKWHGKSNHKVAMKCCSKLGWTGHTHNASKVPNVLRFRILSKNMQKQHSTLPL